MARVTLRLFASAREAAGRSSDELDAAHLHELLALACDRYGAGFAAVLATARVWVNGDEPAHSGLTLTDGDEVAVLPPVSGG